MQPEKGAFSALRYMGKRWITWTIHGANGKTENVKIGNV